MKIKLIALLVVLGAFVQCSSQALNLSTRGYVGHNERVLIVGFMIDDANYNVLVVRALGPSTAGWAVAELPLPNPCIALYNGNGDIVQIQDSYLENSPTDLALLAAKGLTPTNPEECALIVPIQVGQKWTCVVAGKWGTEGIALVEGYYFAL